MKTKIIAAFALLAVIATSCCGCLKNSYDENTAKQLQNAADYAENQNKKDLENSQNEEKNENAEKYVLYKETFEEFESELIYAYNRQGDCVCITRCFPKTEESQKIFTADFTYKILENGNTAVFIKSRSHGEKSREQYKEYSKDGKIVLFRDKEPNMYEDGKGFLNILMNTIQTADLPQKILF